MNKIDFWKEFAVPFGLLILFVIAFFFVFGISKTFTKTPSIDMISGYEIMTDQTEVPVTGVVHNTSELTVGGKEVPVSADGGFSAVVPVELGENTVELSAGSKNPVKATVRIIRSEVQKAVISSTPISTPTSTDLTGSGPAETILGSLGLAAIAVSILIYRRSLRQNSLQKA